MYRKFQRKQREGNTSRMENSALQEVLEVAFFHFINELFEPTPIKLSPPVLHPKWLVRTMASSSFYISQQHTLQMATCSSLKYFLPLASRTQRSGFLPTSLAIRTWSPLLVSPCLPNHVMLQSPRSVDLFSLLSLSFP